MVMPRKENRLVHDILQHEKPCLTELNTRKIEKPIQHLFVCFDINAKIMADM